MKIIIALLLMLSTAHAEDCIASIYTSREGTHTASGQRMCDGCLRAAHKSLPLGSWVTVQNRSNGRSARVQINDRGPYIKGRCIDLTLASARAIGCNGLCRVSVY